MRSTLVGKRADTVIVKEMLGILANTYYLIFIILRPNNITLIKLGKVREVDLLPMVTQPSCGGVRSKDPHRHPKLVPLKKPLKL